MQKKHWTAAEIDQLKALFPNTATAELIPIFGASYSLIANKAYRLGLKKSEEFMQAIGKVRDENLTKAGEKNRFVKGQAAHNKGKQMAKETYAKCANTMFKKGNLPHNTNYDGHIRKNADGYYEQRVELGRYEFCHRLLWQQHYGEIPAGKIVVFQDRNPENLTIENLLLIDRKEHMKRNSFLRFPVDLRNAILSLRTFKKQLHEYEKQNG